MFLYLDSHVVFYFAWMSRKAGRTAQLYLDKYADSENEKEKFYGEIWYMYAGVSYKVNNSQMA